MIGYTNKKRLLLYKYIDNSQVSDTGLIREDAEIHSHVCRVEVISAAEATILGDPAHILTGRYSSYRTEECAGKYKRNKRDLKEFLTKIPIILDLGDIFKCIHRWFSGSNKQYVQNEQKIKIPFYKRIIIF